MKMSFLRPLLTTCLFGAALYYLALFCNQMTDGFSVARIHSDLPYNPSWEVPPPSTAEGQHALARALSQNYHYLGCGGQCFAFGSEDGSYVIKFFKHKIRKPYSYLLHAPLPSFLNGVQRRKLSKIHFKLSRDFTSYKIAYEDLPEETGVIYLHLNKGDSLQQSLRITDKLGIAHHIWLDDVEFVVQRQATLAYKHLAELMQKDAVAQARQSLHALVSTLVKRAQKGIFDEDPQIHRNFGFSNTQPMIIDVGRFIKDPSRKDPAIYRSDLYRITKRLRAHLEETHPQLVATLDEELHAL